MRACGSNAAAPKGSGCRCKARPTSSTAHGLLSSAALTVLTPSKLSADTRQIGQRRPRISQLVDVDRGPGPDQCFDVVEHVPDIDVHSGQHPVVAVEPERDEFTPGDVA